MGTTKKEDELEIFRAGRLGRLQKILWDLFERPHTSIGARVMIYYYLVVTIILYQIHKFANSSDNFMNSVTTFFNENECCYLHLTVNRNT